MRRESGAGQFGTGEPEAGASCSGTTKCDSLCDSCGHPAHDFHALPLASYAYLLGMYLGDGHISRYPRGWRLRVSLDMNWPGIMLECANAMQKVFPENRVSFCQPDPESCCVVASVYSKQLVCLFPQHGPGQKGKTYEYSRYNFTSASDDIRGLFTATCDQLGIEWRRMNARNISVARRGSVARLDEFVGEKN